MSGTFAPFGWGQPAIDPNAILGPQPQQRPLPAYYGPVGTQTVQGMQSADGRPFDPLVGSPQEFGVPVTASQAAHLHDVANNAVNMAMGFVGGTELPPGESIVAYHGGPGSNPYDTVNGTMGTIRDWRLGREGATFFTSDPELASDYAFGRHPNNPTVYRVRLDPSNMMSWDQNQGFKTNRQLMEMAQQQGANLVEVRNASDNVPGGKRPPTNVYMALTPDVIRKYGIAGLMAGGAAAPFGWGAAPQQVQQ